MSSDWWSDNGGLVIGSTIGIIGIIVALLVFWWQRKPKTLDYTIVSTGALLSPRAREGRSPDLDVFYDGRPVEDPHIVSLRVKNTGKVAVVQNDYVQTLEIRTEATRILDCSPLAGSEQFMGLVTLGGVQPAMYVGLSPALLNPREQFDVQLILDGPPGEVTVSCRFKDQSRPMQRRDFAKREIAAQWVQLASSLLGGTVAILGLVLIIKGIDALFS
jgi:hypothetical protein